MNEQQSFKCWCIIELFGHVTLAGYVSEQAIGGASFIRLDVPAVDGQAEFTKLLGASAIYSMTPTSEDVARSAIEHIRARPVNVYYLPSPTAPVDDEVEDGPSLVDVNYIVDHVATLLWIKREASDDWSEEFVRRLDVARSVIDIWNMYCPKCCEETEHGTGTNGAMCLFCGYVSADPIPF